MCWSWFLCGCQCKESNSGISCHSVICTSYSGVAVQLVQSWTNARERIVLRLHLRQCQSGSNVVMVICNCIKSQLSYFIVGQRKEWTYVYFHILYRFQLCFKTLYKNFKYKIKILYCGWVPEVFLACSGNFRCWPKADTSSAVGRSREKNLAKPERKTSLNRKPRQKSLWHPG